MMTLDSYDYDICPGLLTGTALLSSPFPPPSLSFVPSFLRVSLYKHLLNI